MATYCTHRVGFADWIFEVTCRYNVPASIRLLHGEEVAGIGEQGVSLVSDTPMRVFDASDVDEEDLDGIAPAQLIPMQNRMVAAVEGVMRGSGILNERGCCKCRVEAM